MGLVKTRRLAAMQKQQRAKAAMKPPMKGGAGKGVPRQFAPAGLSHNRNTKIQRGFSGTVPAFYEVRWLLRSGWDVWYNARMGLVKTRRLAAMQKQQRAKAAMKPPMKGGAGQGVPRQFATVPKAPLKAF